jgi:tRNA modification GTPase
LSPRSRDPKPRVATVRALYDPTQDPSPNTLLDSGALILYFPSPRTVTGEDILELHVHGGPATVKAVLAAVEKCNSITTINNGGGGDVGVRYAEPGEFTRRAFMNDRLDLPQIEALGDTLHAETEQQRRLAVRGSNNTLSQRYEDWRQQLLYARGELEALIDFSEDQHFDESPQELIGSVAAQVDVLRQQIKFHIQNASKGELLRNGIKIALLGAPNAGKSSLLNRVVGKEAAIVSTEEGTTRDIVDVGIDLGGWYCKIGDMAGLRSSGSNNLGIGTERIGVVELEGIRRAKQRALESDVVVVVLGIDGARLAVDPEVLEAVRMCQQEGKSIVVAINKSDRLPGRENGRGEAVNTLTRNVSTLFGGLSEDRIYSISCKEAEGAGGSLSLSPGQSIPGPGLSLEDPGNIQVFLCGLISVFEEIARPEGAAQGDEIRKNDISYWEDSLGVTHRQQSNLKLCLEHLERFLSETKTNDKNTKQHVYNNETVANPKPNANTQTHAYAHAHAHEMQIQESRRAIQAQTPSNTVYKREEEEEQYSYNNTVMVDAESGVDIVTAAENLRSAAESLAHITGRGGAADVEDVLGVVFEKYVVIRRGMSREENKGNADFFYNRFCVGK